MRGVAWMVVLVAVAAGASADEPWSRWRGAAGAGAGGPRRFPVEWTDDDLRDGGDEWHADLGPYAGEHGFAGSAAVCGDLVIVSNDHEGHSFVAALESATGRERWRLARESGKSGYATPLVIDAPTGRQIVLTCPVNGTSAYHQGCPAKGSPLSAWRGGDGCGRGVVRTSRRGFVPACAPVSSQKSRFVPTRA